MDSRFVEAEEAREKAIEVYGTTEETIAVLRRYNKELVRENDNLDYQLIEARHAQAKAEQALAKSRSFGKLKAMGLIFGGVNTMVYGITGAVFAADGGSFLWHPTLLALLLFANASMAMFILGVKKLID